MEVLNSVLVVGLTMFVVRMIFQIGRLLMNERIDDR